MFKFVHKDNTF